jgi:hypothetical protein
LEKGGWKRGIGYGERRYEWNLGWLMFDIFFIYIGSLSLLEHQNFHF